MTNLEAILASQPGRIEEIRHAAEIADTDRQWFNAERELAMLQVSSEAVVRAVCTPELFRRYCEYAWDGDEIAEYQPEFIGGAMTFAGNPADEIDIQLLTEWLIENVEVC